MAIYRLPFPSESSATTWTSSGNWDVGGAHGAGDPGDNADGQCYAFDITHPTGGKVLAARAGVVIDRDDSVPDDTNPPGKGAGNYIWIRHADNTVAAYLHLKSGSLRVSKDQWVPQGFWIASSGATGNTDPQPTPHLHFEVRTAAEPGTFVLPSFGTSLLIHFEDKTRASFRPGSGEQLSAKSNNVEGDYRQDYWRHCVRCRALYFAGNPGSVCPASGGGEHWHGGGGIYTLSVDATSPVGQKDWRYCGKCHALFFGPSAKSRCPVGPGTAHVASGGNYALPAASAKGIGQAGWRWVQGVRGPVVRSAELEVPCDGCRTRQGGQRRLSDPRDAGGLAKKLARLRQVRLPVLRRELEQLEMPGKLGRPTHHVAGHSGLHAQLLPARHRRCPRPERLGLVQQMPVSLDGPQQRLTLP